MKLEYGIIITVGIFASISLGLIISDPDETPKSLSFEKYSDKLVQINKLSQKYQLTENEQKFDDSKKQMQELLKELSFDYLRLEISNVELIEGQYPFRNATSFEKKFNFEPSSVCDFEEKIPLHMKIITHTENYERFAKKYSPYNLTLSIFDERKPISNIHYGLIATNDEKQMASTYFHLDSCTDEITDKELLFLYCTDKKNDYGYGTFNYDDIVSSYSSIDFCKIELDPWRQSIYDYSQILKEEHRASEMEQMSNITDQESQERTFSEMHKQGELGNIVGNIVHGKFDEQETQEMIKKYEEQYDSLPDELLELIEKRK